jgi:hypothetical protein
VKVVRRLAREKRIRTRLRNHAADPRQPKYLVLVQDVVAYAERSFERPIPHDATDELVERAKQILAHRNTKKPR